MNLARFEARMLKLKGIKLPAQPLIEDDNQVVGRPALVTPNRHHSKLLAEFDQQDLWEPDNDIDDIITGVVRSFDVASSHKGTKLSVAVVRNMINKLPTITTQAIQNNFGYSRAQSKRYAQACRLVMFHKQRHDFKYMANFAIED